MIDINELRRLAQAATHPTTKGRWIRLFGERTVYDRLEDGCRGIPVVSTPAHPPHPFEAACLDFIAAANPAAITELLDRLEAAESDAAHQKALADSALRVAEGWEEKRNALHAAVRHEADCVDAAKAEIEAMRAKITEMEKQEPIGGMLEVAPHNYELRWYKPVPFGAKLYLAPGAQAQPAPSVHVEQDESVRKAWARFGNELHRSPDAPYPGMSEAFEQHFSQSFTDRAWRAESGTWAAAWKAAKRHGAQNVPSKPDGWLRAVDEALVVTHLGGANESDTYEQAREKLNNLIGWHTDVATDPAVNGGWKLVPIEPTPEMIRALIDGANQYDSWNEGYRDMLAAAPEAKP